MKILICITELNTILKYINYVLYMYVCIPLTSDTEKSENSSHDRYRKSERNETNAHWSSSVCSAKCTNVAYISASVSFVKMPIWIVSR